MRESFYSGNAHINLGYNQSLNGGVGSPSAVYSSFSPNPDYPITLAAHSYYIPLNVTGQTPATLRINRFLPEYLYSNRNTSKNYRYSLGLEGHFKLGDHDFNCSQFQRQPGTGQIINLLNLETSASWQKEAGWDFGLNYELPKTSVGEFTLGMQSTYLSSFNMLPSEGAAVIYEAGRYSSWRVRGSLTLGWMLGDFGANWTLRYYSPCKGGCAYPPPVSLHPGFACRMPDHCAPGSGVEPLTQYPSATFSDAQLHWKAPWHATFSLGVYNVFNHVGPYIYGDSFNGGTDSYFDYSASYDIGRYVYVQYPQKF